MYVYLKKALTRLQDDNQRRCETDMNRNSINYETPRHPQTIETPAAS